MTNFEITLPNGFTTDTLPSVVSRCSTSGYHLFTGTKAECETKLAAMLAARPGFDWVAACDEFTRLGVHFGRPWVEDVQARNEAFYSFRNLILN